MKRLTVFMAAAALGLGGFNPAYIFRRPLLFIWRIGMILLKEASRLETLDVHDHPAVLGVQKLHQPAAATYEDEHVTVFYFSSPYDGDC